MIRMVKPWTPILVLAVLGTAAACTEDPIGPGNEGDIDVPTAYAFESRFEDGASSVAYPGQVVRNLLIQDLKSFTDRMGSEDIGPVTVEDFLRLYEYDDASDLTTTTTAGSMPLEEERYSSIATGKNLVGKISDETVIGYDKTADQLMREWFQIIADNSQDSTKRGTPAVYTTADGVDLSQMINKVLTGAVAYSQITEKYLDQVLDQDNTTGVDSGNLPFTAMEHYWDEAFGYFGAARDYGRYSDAELAGSEYYYDSDGNAAIDLESEYNYSLARYAAKRDAGGTGVDFTQEIFDAFLTGRTAIVNQATTQEIAEQRDLIIGAIEKVIAANVIHYINSTLEDMAALTADGDRTSLNEHWAEMKGFAVSLQFNPYRLISDAQLAELHANVGAAPSYALPGTAEYDAAVAALEEARTTLQSVYSFSDENVLNW